MIELTRAQNVHLMAMVGAPTPSGGMQSSMRLGRSQQSFNQSLHTDFGSSFSSSSSSSSSSPLLPPMQPLDGVELSAGAKALVRRHAQLLSGVINSSSSFSMESPSSSSSKQQQQQQHIEHSSTTIHPHTMRVSPVNHMTNTDVDYYVEGAIGGSENVGTGNDSLNEGSFLRVSNSDNGHTQSRSRQQQQEQQQQQQQQQSAQRVPGIRPTNNYATGSSSSSSSSSSLNQKTHPNQTSSSTRQGNTSSGNLVSVSHAAAVASASAVAIDTNRNNSSMRDGVGNSGSNGGDRNIAPTNNEPPSRPDVRAAPYDMVPATNEQRSTGSSSSNTSNAASSSSSFSLSTSTMTAPQFFKLLKARVSPSNLETLMASLSVFNQGSISKGELLSIAERTLAPDPLRMTIAPEIAAKFTQAELTADLTEVFKRLILRSAS